MSTERSHVDPIVVFWDALELLSDGESDFWGVCAAKKARAQEYTSQIFSFQDES
jgi:hypothetical protein